MGLLSALFAPFRVFLNALFSARVRVEGDSMTPTLEDGQSVLVVRPVFPWNRLQRGDVVVLTPPSPTPGLPEGTWFIKRVAGMPGEEIVLQGNRVYADDVLLAELSGGAGRLPGHGARRRPPRVVERPRRVFRAGRQPRRQPRQPPLRPGARRAHHRARLVPHLAPIGLGKGALGYLT